MRHATSVLSALLLGLSLTIASAGRVEAQDHTNDCFVACGMTSQGCVAGLRGGRSECKLACRGIAPGPERGKCKSDCAKVPKPLKQACKVARDTCRSECDHPNACHFACAADGRECFTMARTVATECRMDCRTTAEAAAEACATAADPEACLAEVAEARGACLDQCAMDVGAALAACGTAFEDCKSLCHPNDPNGPPDANEPESSEGDDDDQ
jgi:hypothetical protein